MIKAVWDHLEEIILVPTIIFSVLLVFTQVVLRYVFGNSLSWSEELARYLFIWQVWLGASYSAKKRSHLRITMVRDSLSPAAQKKLEVFVTLVCIAFAVYIAMNGFHLVARVNRFNQMSSALRMPMIYAHLAVPVGCSLMVIRLIENTVKDLLVAKHTGGELG
jgi:TRAP-type C4-dicarboxylate transport system permease small subunit